MEAFQSEQSDLLDQKPKRQIPPLVWVGFIAIDLMAVLGIIVFWLSLAPSQFTPQTIEVTAGSTAAEIADQLEEQGIVRSSELLYGALILFNDPSTIKAGSYTFTRPEGVFGVARFISTSVPSDPLVAVTFPEGFSAREFGSFIPEELNIDDSGVAMQYEGQLFPDTYLVPYDYSERELIDLLHVTFEEKIAPLGAQIAASEFTLEEIIILASIIEREANDPDSMHLVSGILQNRLEIGMALQVDASVAYGLQKSGEDLTRTDMETDGPYNTYTRPGLPAGPIANPGLAAIEAVLNPTPSDYFYYITGNDGNFYYATTLDEHNTNVARYLR